MTYFIPSSCISWFLSLIVGLFFLSSNVWADKLEVVHAKWGTGNKWNDVTENIKKLLEDETKEYSVWKNAFKGGDPAPGWNKKLVITYNFNGQKKTVAYGRGKPFSYERILSHAIGIPYNSSKPIAKKLVDQIAPVTEQILTRDQMASIVVIEGDQGVGSSFLAMVKGKRCVVTNLHVLGNNKKFTIKTLTGKRVQVDVNSLAAAVDADIALLGLTEGQDDLTFLEMAEDVLATTKISHKVVVVGNRQGGGVATQIVGHVRGVGPSRVEVDARFQPGNSGSPIYDVDSGKVIGVASYIQRIPSGIGGPSSLAGLLSGIETRWFGYRIDTIEMWQPIAWKKWRTQITTLTEYHKTSMAAYSVLRGDLLGSREHEKIWGMVTKFLKSGGKFGNNKKSREFLKSISNYLSANNNRLNRVSFYDYFISCPYWETNVTQQKEFRTKLIEAFEQASK